MKNEKDGSWNRLKKELNEKICEITSVWNCGYNRRQIAHNNKIYRWDDPKCTSAKMGFNNGTGTGKLGSTIDKILNINRQDTDLIRPSIIKYDRTNWKSTDNSTCEFYLDFETLNSNFGSIIKGETIYTSNNQYIFLIGVGYIKNNKWIFKNFLMQNKSAESEIEMFNEFIYYINHILKQENKTKAKMYHWSHAEPIAYNSLKNRHGYSHGHEQNNLNLNDSHITFYDLNKIFINEPVTIKGALNFSLKTIAKALNKHELIDSCWDQTSPCSNGLTAMILANKLYESSSQLTIRDEPIMKEIIYYNEIDCKVMWEIHDLIRINN